MRKWLVFFSTFAFVIGLSFCSYVYYYRADFVANSLKNLYGFPVKVAKMRVAKSGIKLLDVVVYNPSEFILQPALSIHSVEIKMTPAELFAAVCGIRSAHIRKINIVDPLVNIEILNANSRDNNWAKILAHLTTQVDTSRTSRRFSIDKINVQDINIQVRNHALVKGTKHPKSIGHIELATIDSNQDTTIPESIFWTTKICLTEVAKRVDQAEFTQSLEASSQLQKRPQNLKIK